MSRIVTYTHHGGKVFVRKDLKGRHREHCLCFCCDRFHPEDEVSNCPVAADVYDTCVRHNIVTPVWECGDLVAVSPSVIERRMEIVEMQEQEDA